MTTISTVKMFYIGNYADMDTDEWDWDNENPNVVLGTHDDLALTDISEVDVNDDNAINDDEYDVGDYLSYNIGAGSVDVALDSSSLYNADILLGDGSIMSVPVLVIQADNGDVFVSEHPAYPLDGLAIQSISLVSLSTSDASGINLGTSNVENATVVCFGAGTLIAAKGVDVSVESLVPGDLVMTLDHGLQPIRWIHSDAYPQDGADYDDKPVLISAGALGEGLPGRDLIVSPQHRILVGGCGQLHGYFNAEAFVPAKSLTSLPGIRHMNGKQRITWVHFACDRHEVVLANGCLSESLLLGPMVLQAMTEPERRTLAGIYGADATVDGTLNGPPARDCLSVGDVRRKLKDKRKAKLNPLAYEIAKWDVDLAMERYEMERVCGQRENAA